MIGKNKVINNLKKIKLVYFTINKFNIVYQMIMIKPWLGSKYYIGKEGRFTLNYWTGKLFCAFRSTI